MAMAPAQAPVPTMMTTEEESTIVVEGGEVPAKKRRRSLLQELGNGPVPSFGEEILGEIYDEMFAPAPAPATTTEEEEILPPVRRKLLQMVEGMMPDMTGMPDPLPSTGDGAMDVGGGAGAGADCHDRRRDSRRRSYSASTKVASRRR